MGNKRNKQLLRSWKKENSDTWNNLRIKLEIIKRDTVNLKWASRKGEWHFSAEIDELKLELSRYMTGKPESYGGKVLIARHFLEKEKWHNLVIRNFGDDVFNEIYLAMKNNYREYKTSS